MGAREQYIEDLRLDCAVCWQPSCQEHGPVPTNVVAKVLLDNYGHLVDRYERARLNLVRILGASDNTELDALVKEVRLRLRGIG